MVEVIKGTLDALFAGMPMVAVVLWTLMKILAITVPLILAVAFYTLAVCGFAAAFDSTLP